MKFQSMFSIGYKHFYSSISTCFKLIKENYDEAQAQNPFAGILKSFYDNPLTKDDIIRFIKPIQLDTKFKIPIHIINNVFINNKTEYSFYLKILSANQAILFISYGYPIVNYVDDWFTLENPLTFFGIPKMLSRDSIEIEFESNGQCLYFDGIFNADNSISGKLDAKPSSVVYQKDIFDFKLLKDF